MRKTLAFCLVLLLALVSVAHADPAADPAAPEESYVLCARLEADGSYSYALIGSGDGADAFAALAGAGGTYEERFAALWEVASKLEPALSAEGGEEVLAFALGFGADGSAVRVSLGSEGLATLTGKAAFAIVTGSFAAGNPALSGDCEVYIWTLEGAVRFAEEAAGGEPLSLCPNCGGIDDGSKEHTAAISKFCKEGHTKCMGDPEHYCDPDDGGCGRTYPCSKSNSHTKCLKCGKLWCYKKHGDHKELKCGHRGCEVYGEEEKHAKCPACGGYFCNGKNHALCDHCGQPLCNGTDHSVLAECHEHYVCEGGNHEEAECFMHYVCEGGEHYELPCAHYACEGGNHSICEFCDDYICLGGPHGDGICNAT